MQSMKYPKLANERVWMAWTYGELNHSKDSVKSRISSTMTPFSRWSFIDQTHSDIVKEAVKVGSLGEADAQYTSEVSLGLAVQTADCVPVFLIELDTGQTQVGVVHAGWRDSLIRSSPKRFLKCPTFILQ